MDDDRGGDGDDVCSGDGGGVCIANTRTKTVCHFFIVLVANAASFAATKTKQ